MIAILSKNELEQSTEDVIDCLEYSNQEYIRINGNDFLKRVRCVDIKSSIDEIPIAKINISWFRRWFDDSTSEKIVDDTVISNLNSIKLYQHLIKEESSVSTILWSQLREKKWLTNPTELRAGKLKVLITANNLGIEIPETIITTSKDELVKFKNKCKRIVSKSITEVVNFMNKMDNYSTMTVEIKEEDIERLNQTFFPSLFQQLIEKEYEIRTFYLDGKFYSMAIFSQFDPKTTVDFRNYNMKNPNRVVPYTLPEKVEVKLKSLMETLGLSTGSLDIIKSNDGRYVFLECNAVGQYGMVSSPCNYYLDRKIADYLAKNDN